MTHTDHIIGSPASLAEHHPDGQGREDASALLGLEPPAVEKAGENSNSQPDPASSTCYAPLLGTTLSQSIDNAGGSSEKRSPESICYPKLLRENGLSSGRKPSKTVPVEGRVCYLAFMPDGGHLPVQTTASARLH